LCGSGGLAACKTLFNHAASFRFKRTYLPDCIGQFKRIFFGFDLREVIVTMFFDVLFPRFEKLRDQVGLVKELIKVA
jgi:hypothetical protein